MLEKYDVLLVCSYYKPYISGLTNVVIGLAEELARRKKNVAVICYASGVKQAKFEEIAGVHVYRVKPLIRISRASFNPEYILLFRSLAHKSKKINIHLPLPEAGLLSLLCSNPILITYQCDAPKNSIKNNLTAMLLDLSSSIAIRRARKVIYSSLDYLQHSRLQKVSKSKYEIIPPFFKVPINGKPTFRDGSGKHFGYLGRFTSEKGIIFLIQTFLLYSDPDARLLIAGNSLLVGDNQIKSINKLAKLDKRIKVLTNLTEQEKADFFASIDVFCFPSLNSFEAFGIVQLESLSCGIPVICSDLPGVRSVVENEKFGRILPVGETSAWLECFQNEIPHKLTLGEINQMLYRYNFERLFDKYREILY